MSNWSSPAKITQLSIDDLNVTVGSNKSIELLGGFLQFEYFESLLSPYATANLLIIDTGYAVIAGPQEDLQERLGTLRSSTDTLKGKTLTVKISHPSVESGIEGDGLEFSADNPWRISDTPLVMDSSKVEVFTLKLRPQYAINNEKTKAYKTYVNKIRDNVIDILASSPQDGGLGANPGNVTERYDDTVNKCTERGQGRNPFDVIIALARQAIPTSPANAKPGCFFYETQDGFNFKGIDNLINQTPYQFGYVHGAAATFCEGSNFRILDYQVRSSMRDLFKSLNYGENMQLATFDPISLDFGTALKVVEDTGYTLGGDTLLQEIVEESENYSTFFDLKAPDDGNVGISSEVNNPPDFWRVQALTRYNSLLNKIIDIVVPCNLQLRAGMVLDCAWMKKTDKPEQGISDEKLSGKYLIMHLSHKFNGDGQTGSLTHMTIVRDTDGIYSDGGS